MHCTDLLERFRTGTKGKVTCVIVNTVGENGKPIEYVREGDNYLVPLGDGIEYLTELIARRKQLDTFWGKFSEGNLQRVELDISIKKLKEVLNQTSMGWTE